ncbi:MAG: hypothetical protein ACXVZP_07125 [Gaiellaceae bacterium]
MSRDVGSGDVARPGRRPVIGQCPWLLLLLAPLVLGFGASAQSRARIAADRSCPRAQTGAGYATRVERALASGRDVWGESLLRSAKGPTYASIAGLLRPLLLVGRPAGTSGDRLTDSGVYYLPLAQPSGVRGALSVALHVADGSQIVSERGDGASLTISVGAAGRERYGSCLARLVPASLADGYLPILETGYVDASGASYRQESFTTRIPETRSQVSFVRLTVAPRSKEVSIRFDSSGGAPRASAGRLLRHGRTVAFFSPGGRLHGSSLVYRIPAGPPRTVYFARLVGPAASADLGLADEAYEAARAGVVGYWQARLREGTTFVVPERRVLDAERGLLVQNLLMTWRYSLGNDYEEYSFPESIDSAEVMGEYGFEAAERAMLRAALVRPLKIYPDLEIGEKLLGLGLEYRLSADRSLLDEAGPLFRGYLARLGRQLSSNPHGILDRERYSSDLPDRVYGLNAQAVVWQGLRSMQQAWLETGHADLARTAGTLAQRLGRGLRRAMRASERRLEDGSLFLPVKLLDGETPYRSVTASRPGSYWNLVIPYVLASGLIEPASAQARGIFRYLQLHGSRFLGLVRSAAFAVYRDPPPSLPTSGSNEVYGLNLARFLADNDLPDQLVLSFYGQLAAAMTPRTHVAGEAASIAPIPGEAERRMYLPPNGTANATLLEKLRLMLVHETQDRSGRADGLELAFATPRAWLEPGRRIDVRAAPTAFGPLSYSISAARGSLRVSLSVPSRSAPASLRLRLRLPRQQRIAAVSLDGRPYRRFSRTTATIDLSGLRGDLELTAKVSSG